MLWKLVAWASRWGASGHTTLGGAQATSSPYQACSSAQVRVTTMRYVDALKSLTYAFLLGQRIVHQPGGALRDAMLTALTSVALPGLVLVCLEARPPAQQPSLARWWMHPSLCKALMPVAASRVCFHMDVPFACFPCPVLRWPTASWALPKTSCGCTALPPQGMQPNACVLRSMPGTPT